MEAKVFKRIYKEVEDVNADFFNLRTVIKPDPDDDMTRFTYIMQPNDGAMAHLTLVGAFYIPPTYPVSPPVVHLYTRTGRHNVDAYLHNANANRKTASSLCFNILRTAAPGGPADDGTWQPDCTLSALFAALMSAIVSFYVPQSAGHDHPEYVSLANLKVLKQNVKESYEKHKDSMPPVPRAPCVEATRVPATELAFPAEITMAVLDDLGVAGPMPMYIRHNFGVEKIVSAGPIFLQTSDPTAIHTFAVDLSELHEDVVFSVILSNKSHDDFAGKKRDTVLVRNGVTATAARKRAGKKTQWFYHGKPMNDGDMRLHVTIGADQMTMAYYSEDGLRYVLGDTPVSRLRAREIGEVRDMPFWVHIYTKNKSKVPAKIYMLDTGGFGYIHRDSEDREFEFVAGAQEEVPLKRKEVVVEEEWQEVAADGSGDTTETVAAGADTANTDKQEKPWHMYALLAMFREEKLRK